MFQHPGPDGQRPGVLAMRTSASKQAMNHLLHQLETGGYILREAHPDDRRTRVVRLTERGWAALGVIRQTMVRLERRVGRRRSGARRVRRPRRCALDRLEAGPRRGRGARTADAERRRAIAAGRVR